MKKQSFKCCDYNQDDSVNCRVCGNTYIVSQMPKTKTGFRFVCSKCLSDKSLMMFHKKKYRRVIPINETILAVRSIIETPRIMKSSSVEGVLSLDDGRILVTPKNVCVRSDQYERIIHGSIGKRGYYTYNDRFSGKVYYVHRIVCESFFGESSLQVNHINGNRLDNSILNLEYVENRENSHHKNVLLSKNKKKAYKNNNKTGKVWYSRIKKDGKDIYLGSFNTEKEAIGAYDTAMNELYCEINIRYNNGFKKV